MMQKLRETMEQSIIIVLIISLVVGLSIGMFLGNKTYGLQLDTATKAFNQCRELYNKNCALNAADIYNNILFDQFCLNEYNNSLRCKQLNITIGDLK